MDGSFGVDRFGVSVGLANISPFGGVSHRRAFLCLRICVFGRAWRGVCIWARIANRAVYGSDHSPDQRRQNSYDHTTARRTCARCHRNYRAICGAAAGPTPFLTRGICGRPRRTRHRHETNEKGGRQPRLRRRPWPILLHRILPATLAQSFRIHVKRPSEFRAGSVKNASSHVICGLDFGQQAPLSVQGRDMSWPWCF